jgi:hypothetical protein
MLPCVKSLYHLSKLAEIHPLPVIIPPTILIGFGDEPRLIWNSGGVIKVSKGQITPDQIEHFIHDNITVHLKHQTIEEQLLYPSYVIRAQSGAFFKKNETKIFFSKEALLSEMMTLWGHCDMAVQAFVRQKHLSRGASIIRYQVNSKGLLYKA